MMCSNSGQHESTLKREPRISKQRVFNDGNFRTTYLCSSNSVLRVPDQHLVYEFDAIIRGIGDERVYTG